jgi:hypothetical protein
MKKVEIEYNGNEQHVMGEVVRQYLPELIWSNPPEWPEIYYFHTYERAPFALFGITRGWDEEGELVSSDRRVRILSPTGEPSMYWELPDVEDLEYTFGPGSSIYYG